MRRFRFIGDPSDYLIEFKRCNVYNGNQKAYKQLEGTIEDDSKEYPNNWEEVFEIDPKDLNNFNSSIIIEPKNHKDTDLGYFAGLAMQGIISSPYRKDIGEEEEIATLSIIVAKELIKQLDKECQ